MAKLMNIDEIMEHVVSCLGDDEVDPNEAALVILADLGGNEYETPVLAPRKFTVAVKKYLTYKAKTLAGAMQEASDQGWDVLPVDQQPEQ